MPSPSPRRNTPASSQNGTANAYPSSTVKTASTNATGHSGPRLKILNAQYSPAANMAQTKSHRLAAGCREYERTRINVANVEMLSIPMLPIPNWVLVLATFLHWQH